jgi:hypothetical protein
MVIINWYVSCLFSALQYGNKSHIISVNHYEVEDNIEIF